MAVDNSVTSDNKSVVRISKGEPGVKAKKSNNTATRLTSEEKILGRTLKNNVRLSNDELAAINTKKGLLQLLGTKNINVEKALIKLRYEQELEKLQMDCRKLQALKVEH